MGTSFFQWLHYSTDPWPSLPADSPSIRRTLRPRKRRWAAARPVGRTLEEINRHFHGRGRRKRGNPPPLTPKVRLFPCSMAAMIAWSPWQGRPGPGLPIAQWRLWRMPPPLCSSAGAFCEQVTLFILKKIPKNSQDSSPGPVKGHCHCSLCSVSAARPLWPFAHDPLQKIGCAYMYCTRACIAKNRCGPG